MTRRCLSTLIFLIATLLTLPLLAQPPSGHGGRAWGGPGGEPGPPGERLAEFLELTPDQQAQWETLHQEFRDSIRPLFEQQRSQTEELRALLEATAPDPFEVGTLVIAQRDSRRAMEAAHNQLQEQLKAILTPKQLERFEAFQALRPERHRGPHRGRGPGSGGPGPGGLG